MRKLLTLTLAAAIATGTAAGIAAAADPAIENAVKARQAHMRLYAFHLGTLGAMAKGARPYDAGVAEIAAGNLAKLVTLNQGLYWPEGSDSESYEKSAALPKLWENFADVAEKGQALADAVAELQDMAVMDAESLAEGVAKVGAACKACHKAYRKPKE